MTMAVMGLAAGASQLLGSTGAVPAATPRSPADNLALAMRFSVKIGGAGQGLGNWSSCSAPGMSFNAEAQDEGGDYVNALFSSKRVSYTDVTLERAVTASNSKLVHAWLTTVQNQWTNWNGEGTRYQGETVTITVYGTSTSGKAAMPVVAWILNNAVPISWTGPTLSARSTEFATEKLVLRYGSLSLGGTP
jgi:phage tail-like protein